MLAKYKASWLNAEQTGPHNLIWRSGKALGDLPVASPDGTQDSESDRSERIGKRCPEDAVLGCGVFGEDGRKLQS